MSEITNHIEGITGVSTANTDFIESAQRSVASKIPKELMLWAITETVPGTHGGNNSNQQITLPVKTDSLVHVRRDQFEASKVDGSMRGFIGNSNSLYLATNTFPKYYIADGNRVIVKPDPDDTYTAHAQYVDYTKINEDSDLRNAVVYHACSSEFEKLSSGKIIDWTDLVLPVSPASPSFGGNLTISAVAPVVPVLSDSTVSFSQGAPTFTQPVLSISTFPTISWTLPSLPAVPVIQDNSLSFSTSVPTFTPPVMSALDFSDTENWITVEEDSEMLASRVQEIQAKVSEYSARMGEAQAAFNKENVEYQAQLQVSTQNAQLSSADDGQKIQKYSGEIGAYTSEVNSIVAFNSGEIAQWQQENTMNFQKYGADIQNNLNKFNEENAEYQAQLQISVQDAQLSSQDDAQKIQKYGAESGNYQQDVNIEIQDYVNTLNKKVQEYQSETALYGANLQKFQSELGEKTQKVALATQNATYYSNESKKFYEWSLNEINTYIQYNSKMINRTMAAQQQQQRR